MKQDEILTEYVTQLKSENEDLKKRLEEKNRPFIGIGGMWKDFWSAVSTMWDGVVNDTNTAGAFFVVTILGGTVVVPSVDGKATIRIPPGTSSGQKFRLRGKGVAAGREPAGDLYAIIQIHPPRELDTRSQELMEEFQRLNPAP